MKLLYENISFSLFSINTDRLFCFLFSELVVYQITQVFKLKVIVCNTNDHQTELSSVF